MTTAPDISPPPKKTRKPLQTRVIVIKAEAGGESKSNALSDPWSGWDWSNWSDQIISPPFDPYGLMIIAEESGELGSNIETMATNVSGFGWRLKRLKHTAPVEQAPEDEEDIQEVDPEAVALEAAVLAERERLEAFLKYVDYDENSFTLLRKKIRMDEEETGNAYLEVIRNARGDAVSFRHLESFTMRLTKEHPDVLPVRRKQQIYEGGEPRIQEVQKFRRFRKFVQAQYDAGWGFSPVASAGTSEQPRLMWFKQYGDPRVMDSRNGEFVEDPSKLPRRYWATEVLHIPRMARRSPYGIPRWMGALVPLLGVRSAEEINFSTFKNNNIPSMAIIVTGGQLSEGTIGRLQEFVEAQIQGDDNYSKFLIFEAESSEESYDGITDNTKISIEPLTSEQHTDALFTAYDEKSRDKIRQAFRIPSILVGRSSDYTRSTAETSVKMADEQIFNPERLEEDHLFNSFLVQEFSMLYHQFVTNTPNTTNDQDLIKVMGAAERTGSMTPRIAHAMLEDIMGQELPYAQDLDRDVPFSLQMAQAVKNQAKPNEVGQQVTALKSMLQDRISKALDEGYDALDIMEALYDAGASAGLEKHEVLEALGVEQ